MVLTSILLVPLSIVWAPFAALISASQARRRGSTDWRYYRMVGALYSVLLLLPWIYLTLRLAGRTVPLSLIRGVYIAIYVLWAFYLLITFYLRLASPQNDAQFWLVLAVGIFAFFVSAWMLIRHTVGNDQQEGVQHTENDYRLTQRGLVYLTPFVFLIFHAVAIVSPFTLWSVFIQR